MNEHVFASAPDSSYEALAVWLRSLGENLTVTFPRNVQHVNVGPAELRNLEVARAVLVAAACGCHIEWKESGAYYGANDS